MICLSDSAGHRSNPEGGRDAWFKCTVGGWFAALLMSASGTVSSIFTLQIHPGFNTQRSFPQHDQQIFSK